MKPHDGVNTYMPKEVKMSELERLRAENALLQEEVERMSGTFTCKDSIVKDAARWQTLERLFDEQRIYIVPSTGNAFSEINLMRLFIDAAEKDSE